MAQSAVRPASGAELRAAVLVTVALTLLRLTALFLTPLQLYPDEAQYWLWSRDLAFGYYSKPPMVAWAIAASTALGGDAEPWVRLSSALFQGAAGFVVFLIGRRLYGASAGLAALALYALMPGVQLSALVAATDAPLLFFLGVAVLAYVRLVGLGSASTPPPPFGSPSPEVSPSGEERQPVPPPLSGGEGPQSTPSGGGSQREGGAGLRSNPVGGGGGAGTARPRIVHAAALGAALGLAFLSKYAAVYFLLGLVLHLALSREARRAWNLPRTAVAVAAFAVLLAPNVAWNATHGFATLQHTAANAAWGGPRLFNTYELGRFFLTQFGVFGPIPFGVLIVGAGLAVARRRLSREDLLLLCFTLPPLAIVMAQAFVSRANANWSGAGYVTGAVLAAAWLVRWRARRWLAAAIGVQALVAAAFLVAVVDTDVANRPPFANAFKRARGWSETTQAVLDRASREPGLTAVAVNNRFLFYALSYYGRDRRHPPLAAWLLMDGPRNQAETTAPLTAALGGRVLAVSYEGVYRDLMEADFARTSGLEIASVSLDPRHRRRVFVFVGEGFAPRPRDPVSGLPKRP